MSREQRSIRSRPARACGLVSPTVLALVLALGAGQAQADCLPASNDIEDGDEVICTGTDNVGIDAQADNVTVRVGTTGDPEAEIGVTGGPAIDGEGLSWLVDVRGLVLSDQTAVRLHSERDDPEDPAAGPGLIVRQNDPDADPAQVPGVIRSIGTDAADHAVHMSGDRAGVDNAGVIEAAGGHALWLENSASVTNRSSGVIRLLDSASGWAVLVNGADGTVDNSGDILAGESGASNAAGAVRLEESGFVNNRTGARIIAESGPAVSMDSGTVANFGATDDDDAAEIRATDGVAIEFLVGRGAVNNAGLIVSETDTAIDMEDGGTVSNSGEGEIRSDAGTAIHVRAQTPADPEDDRPGFSLTNEALIYGETQAILGQDLGRLSFRNRGTIEGGSGVELEMHVDAEGDTLSNEADGEILATTGAAVRVTRVETILNAGLMHSEDSWGLDATDALEIDNRGTISSDTGGAIQLTGGGVLRNRDGSLIEGAQGIVADGGPTDASLELRNDGVIRATGAGPALDVSGGGSEIHNFGEIDGDVAIADDFAHAFTNHLDALITGDTGFTTTLAHTLENAGTVDGNITMGTGDATLTLRGTGSVTGNVALGDGDNQFNFHSGASVDGTISAGAGTSTLSLLAGIEAVGRLGDTTGFTDLEVDAAGVSWRFTEDNQSFSGALALDAGELDFRQQQNISFGADSMAAAGTTMAFGVNQNGTDFGQADFSGQTLTLDADTVLLIDPDAGDWGSPATTPFTFPVFQSTTFVGEFGAVEAGFFDREFDHGTGIVELTRNFANEHVADTDNRLAVGTALQDMVNADQMSAGLEGLRNSLLGTRGDDLARARLDDLSGELHAAQTGALFQHGNAFRDSVHARSEALRVARHSRSSEPVQMASLATRGVFMPDEYVALADAAHRAWARAYHTRGTLDGNGGSADADYRINGLTVGYDQAAFGDWRVGAALAFGSSRTGRGGGSRDRLNADSARGSLYGLYSDGPWDAQVLVGGAWLEFDSERTVMGSTQAADYEGREWFASVEGGYTLAVADGDILLRPAAGLDWARIERDGFSEDDGGGLEAESSTTRRAEGRLKLEAAMPRETAGGMHWTPTLRAAYARDLVDDNAEMTARFVGDDSGQSFVVRGADTGRDRFEAGGGVVLRAAEDMQLHFDYSFHASAGQQGHTVSFGLRQHW